MCGLCGVVHPDPSWPVDPQRLARMRDEMTHRGPDDAGAWIGPGAGLGSRRLSIIDLSERGRMPMSTPDGRYHIVYNGEVYNAGDLRAGLVARGYPFRSRTDTEVVLALYAEEGPAMLERLNGMFGIAIWDEADRTLFLARDRLGVKPLYYAEADRAFWFASEAKALFAAGLTPRFDPSTWQELLCFRYVAGERSPYLGVRRLLPGHYLIWRNGRAQVTRWWNLARRAEAARAAPPADAASAFRETFDDSIRLRRISDVPVGVLLSGGLDSGSVAAAVAAQAGKDVASFTVRFDQPSYDEGPIAREVAERWGLQYHELTVPAAGLSRHLLEASWLNDEPIAHGNELHIRAISAYAKPLVTVLLSGEGGDETMGGYVRYRPLRYRRLLTHGRAVIAALAKRQVGRAGKLGRLAQLGTEEAYALFNACEILPPALAEIGSEGGEGLEYRRQVLDEARATYPGELMRQTMYLDQHTFMVSLLDRNDRVTMGASIECRVPFLDYRLVELLASLPSRRLLSHFQSKAILRRGLGDRLPERVLRYRKWGFGVPWGEHLRREPELRDTVATLPASPLLLDVPCDRQAVGRLVDRFLGGDARTDALVRQLVMLEYWRRACLSGAAAPAVTGVRPAS